MFTVKFLGTGGARFVMMSQLRKSGGIYITTDDTRIHIDPGPGALINMLSSRPRLDPKKTDIIILTHRHLDHSNDINLMIECMTESGFQKRGILFTPSDCLNDDSPVLKYVRDFPEEIKIMKEGVEFSHGNTKISSPLLLRHGVENYAIRIEFRGKTIFLVSDTEFFEDIIKFSKCHLLIAGVLSPERREGILHLSFDDFLNILTRAKPGLAVMTHFGMKMIKMKPWKMAEEGTKKTGVKIIAANDGMSVNVEEELKNSP